MNKFKGYAAVRPWFAAMLLAFFVAGCGGGGGGAVATVVTAAPGVVIVPGVVGATDGAATDPSVRTASPGSGATNVPTSQAVGIGTRVTVIFSQAMDPATLNSDPAGTLLTFTLKQTLAGTNVAGTVEMNADNTVATFKPSAALIPSTSYTASVSTAAKNAAGKAMANPVVWSFTTAALAVAGLVPVNLGSAGSFAILSKSGISTVPSSLVTGDIGVSPIAQVALTGFAETMHSSNTFSTSTQVVGKIYAADYTPPTPSKMTTAIGDMETAYTDAAGRTLPDHTELGAGQIGSLTLAPGLYKWGTNVLISTDVTLNGSATDVWIFQISQNLSQASATNVKLTGGALAKNVFWQVAGAAIIETTAHFEGIILSKTAINVKTNASVKGRLLAQTDVTLEQNAVTQPAP